MNPPMQASTCRGSPFSMATLLMSCMGSTIPWGYCGAEASRRMVEGVMACKWVGRWVGTWAGSEIQR